MGIIYGKYLFMCACQGLSGDTLDFLHLHIYFIKGFYISILPLTIPILKLYASRNKSLIFYLVFLMSGTLTRYFTEVHSY